MWLPACFTAAPIATAVVVAEEDILPLVREKLELSRVLPHHHSGPVIASDTCELPARLPKFRAVYGTVQACSNLWKNGESIHSPSLRAREMSSSYETQWVAWTEAFVRQTPAVIVLAVDLRHADAVQRARSLKRSLLSPAYDYYSGLGGSSGSALSSPSPHSHRPRSASSSGSIASRKSSSREGHLLWKKPLPHVMILGLSDTLQSSSDLIGMFAADSGPKDRSQQQPSLTIRGAVSVGGVTDAKQWAAAIESIASHCRSYLQDVSRVVKRTSGDVSAFRAASSEAAVVAATETRKHCRTIIQLFQQGLLAEYEGSARNALKLYIQAWQTMDSNIAAIGPSVAICFYFVLSVRMFLLYVLCRDALKTAVHIKAFESVLAKVTCDSPQQTLFFLAQVHMLLGYVLLAEKIGVLHAQIAAAGIIAAESGLASRSPCDVFRDMFAAANYWKLDLSPHTPPNRLELPLAAKSAAKKNPALTELHILNHFLSSFHLFRQRRRSQADIRFDRLCESHSLCDIRNDAPGPTDASPLHALRALQAAFLCATSYSQRDGFSRTAVCVVQLLADWAFDLSLRDESALLYEALIRLLDPLPPSISESALMDVHGVAAALASPLLGNEWWMLSVRNTSRFLILTNDYGAKSREHLLGLSGAQNIEDADNSCELLRHEAQNCIAAFLTGRVGADNPDLQHDRAEQNASAIVKLMNLHVPTTTGCQVTSKPHAPPLYSTLKCRQPVLVTCPSLAVAVRPRLEDSSEAQINLSIRHNLNCPLTLIGIDLWLAEGKLKLHFDRPHTYVSYDSPRLPSVLSEQTISIMIKKAQTYSSFNRCVLLPGETLPLRVPLGKLLANIEIRTIALHTAEFEQYLVAMMPVILLVGELGSDDCCRVFPMQGGIVSCGAMLHTNRNLTLKTFSPVTVAAAPSTINKEAEEGAGALSERQSTMTPPRCRPLLQLCPEQSPAGTISFLPDKYVNTLALRGFFGLPPPCAFLSLARDRPIFKSTAPRRRTVKETLRLAAPPSTAAAAQLSIQRAEESVFPHATLTPSASVSVSWTGDMLNRPLADFVQLEADSPPHAAVIHAPVPTLLTVRYRPILAQFLQNQGAACSVEVSFAAAGVSSTTAAANSLICPIIHHFVSTPSTEMRVAEMRIAEPSNRLHIHLPIGPSSSSGPGNEAYFAKDSSAGAADGSGSVISQILVPFVFVYRKAVEYKINISLKVAKCAESLDGSVIGTTDASTSLTVHVKLPFRCSFKGIPQGTSSGQIRKLITATLHSTCEVDLEIVDARITDMEGRLIGALVRPPKQPDQHEGQIVSVPGTLIPDGKWCAVIDWETFPTGLRQPVASIDYVPQLLFEVRYRTSNTFASVLPLSLQHLPFPYSEQILRFPLSASERYTLCQELAVELTCTVPKLAFVEDAVDMIVSVSNRTYKALGFRLTLHYPPILGLPPLSASDTPGALISPQPPPLSVDVPFLIAGPLTLSVLLLPPRTTKHLRWTLVPTVPGRFCCPTVLLRLTGGTRLSAATAAVPKQPLSPETFLDSPTRFQMTESADQLETFSSPLAQIAILPLPSTPAEVAAAAKFRIARKIGMS